MAKLAYEVEEGRRVHSTFAAGTDLRVLWRLSLLIQASNASRHRASPSRCMAARSAGVRSSVPAVGSGGGGAGRRRRGRVVGQDRKGLQFVSATEERMVRIEEEQLQRALDPGGDRTGERGSSPRATTSTQPVHSIVSATTPAATTAGPTTSPKRSSPARSNREAEPAGPETEVTAGPGSWSGKRKVLRRRRCAFPPVAGWRGRCYLAAAGS